MITFFLLSLSILSFLFFGVVGEDKTWLLAPAMVLNHVLVLGWWVGKARQLSAGEKHGSVGCYFSIDTICWLLFLIYGIAIIPFSTVPFESKLELLFLGSVFGAFIVWRNEVTSFKESRVYVALLFGVVLICALYGLVIHFKAPEQILWTERYTDAYEGRLRSTYICPNHFAHLLQMLMPFFVVWLFIKQVGVTLKGLALYSFIAFLPPLFLTESRAGWLGTLASVGVLGLLFAWRKSKKLFWVMLIVIPLLGSSLLVAGYHYSETFQRRMEPVVTFLEGQAEEGIGSESRDFRPQTWMDTLEMIGDEPVWGHGPGAYRYTYPEYRNRFRGQRIVTGHPHNEYLELAADYGWVGFSLFGLAWLGTLFKCLRLASRSTEVRHSFVGIAAFAMGIGTMVHSFFDFQMHIYPNAMVFAFLMASSIAPMERHQKARGWHLKRPWMAWMAAAICLGSLLWCVQVMASASLRAEADRRFVAVKSSNDNTLQLTTRAVQLDESNWRAHRTMGSTLYDLRYYALDMSEKVAIAERELKAYQCAYEHNPKDPEICAGLGKVYLFLHHHEKEGSIANHYKVQGLAYLREACSLRKYNDLYWWVLGSELRDLGEYDEALEAFERASKIKNSASIRANIKWLKERVL